MISFRNINSLKSLSGSLNFSTFGSLNSAPDWVVRQWKPPKTNDALINLPDYSFLDQRPTPYGAGQRRRIEKQKQYTARIIKLTSEIDLAINLHKQREAAKQNAIKERLSKKLTEKGSKTVGD